VSAADRTLRGLVFAERPGFRPLELDLHRPEADGAPVVLFLHGGGWRLGSRRVMVPHALPDGFARLTAAGLAVVSADYRLSGEARFPAQLDDVRDALAWVAASGAEHGVDPSRIVLWGESAGATLALLVGLGAPEGVRGIVDWYGPTDLLAMAGHTGVDGIADVRETGWLGVPAPQDPERARAASPLSRVQEGAPPVLVAHGEDDDAVPIAQSLALVDALASLGADVELRRVPGAGHLWRAAADPGAELDAAIAFARRVTAGGGDDRHR